LDPDLASRIAQTLIRPENWSEAKLLCWVLMPDHWHGLVELGSESLSRTIGRTKASATRYRRQALGRQERLWDHGFHDHAIRTDEDLLQIARYIVANPIRAGLAGRAGDYPYWNAVWF